MAYSAGIRVVRGPNWKYGDEDGGDGCLGTVVGIPGSGPEHGTVKVVWDFRGVEKTYSAGKDNRFDLRIYDLGPIGVKHPGVSCDACRTSAFASLRWKCNVCKDFDLCSSCYHGDRHERGHAFLRYATDVCNVTKVPERNLSSKKEIFGLVKGTEVSRGLHWSYGDQDGGAGSRGTIVEVGTFSGGHVRGGVRVNWRARPDNSLGYKIGAKGKVDLVAQSRTSGGKYYHDHLPCLDALNPEHVVLKKGDKVKITVDTSTFRKMQNDKLCGWNKEMSEYQHLIGTVVSMPQPSTLRVQFEDARTWSIVRGAIQRISSFSVGDSVKMTDCYNAAVELQIGHGGWNDKMETALGKVGRVLSVDDDGDLRVALDGHNWLVSPVSCTILDVASLKPQRPSVKPDSKMFGSKIGLQDVSEILNFTEDNQVSEFFQAADQGDLKKVQNFLESNRSQINVQVKGNTALHIAAHRGHLGIVRQLLEFMANKNIADAGGDTPLHNAVDGEQIAVLQELCGRGVNLNAQNNKGLTPLHMAVDQDSLECVRVLVNKGADVNIQDQDQDTVMHDAIKKGNKEIIKVLLECHRLDGSRTNKDKLNIMHMAVIHAQQSVVEALIGRNIKLASVVGGADNWTPLHLAAMNGRTALAGVLVKKGNVMINVIDKNMRTPLHYAVQSCENTIIELLLGRDADPNIQDSDGNSPTHLAQMAKLPTAGEKKEEETLVQSILCMLAEFGADLNLKNKGGKSPLDLCKNPQLVQKLKGIAGRVMNEHREKDDVPAHWNSMIGVELVVQDLTMRDALTSEEYKNVSRKFIRTMANVEIVSIKRIQNRSLWDAYNVTKRTMERKYGLGCANELNLFHGTSPISVEPIQHQNIDPLLAGNNVGAIWGKGAYFAVDAKQSDNYASASDEGHRYMFVSRVLAGRYAQGSKSLQRPPPLDASDPNDLADAVVDNVDNPRIYVIFRNQQIYPEFLVKYV